MWLGMSWNTVNNWCRSHVTLRTLYLLFLGQVVSFLLALLSLFSSLIAKLGVDAPLTQSLFVYFNLALIYGSFMLSRRQKPRISWYWYLLLGFVDVQGNYLVNKAFQFSSITSVTLLDCWTVAWVIILTWIFIGTRYSLWQLFGAAVCVLGLGLVLLSDAGVGGGGGSKPLLGDMLVIAGTVFFAMSNVGEEFCVKKKDRIEVVSMIGVYGFLVSVCEICIVERKALESVKWSAEIILAFAGYALSGVLFYTFTPFVLKLSGATLFNLSILTSDMWAVVFRIFLYHQQVDWLYYIAFAVVVIGLIVYSTTGNDAVPEPALEDGNLTIEYESLTRPPAALARTWQQSHFSHFSSSPSPSSSSSATGPPSSSSSASPSTSVPPPPRSGVAIGVPAHHPTPPSQPAPFSSSYGQHFGALARGGVNLPEPTSSSNALQVKSPMQGMQGMGMLGSLNSTSQMRPGGFPAHHQQRPVQSSLRPPSTSNNQPPSPQNFQGHGLLRASSVGSPGSPSPSTSQSMQSLNQPWLSSGSQGKPPLPSPSYRQQVNSPSLQQRSHLQQQQPHSLTMASSQQHMTTTSQQQQPSTSHQSHEHYGQQVPSPRIPQALSHQQPITRVQGSLTQKSSSPAIVQLTQSSQDPRIEQPRQKLMNLLIDPSEKLDPEVEDVLMDIADDFVESITTYGCSLAKHRKSTMLEAKDILLHLERNWNINLPGFAGDEIKTYRKPLVNDIHKERIAAIKKSMALTETANTRNSTGQATGNAKASLMKNPANVIGSPNVKT
ncbi:hypothetical protein FNV43_RR15600 [Rhamnella rubrinervis]|uniref:Transcription initiation factor TFIID subunit 12 domain-containing protein n=1 Tax=Rhamnella rubrinervis TaxID=2594499 RepID=A0A8K0GYC6_9ROSA|nr:hypothetical protein FNV43_RR15600 [Rhamnella rubrinervis]